MRHPNGYGSVVKLSGKRRKPYAVRKTLGFDDRGYPLYEIIGYCKTRVEGLQLLAEYNKDPWDVEDVLIPLEQLFEMWLERKAHKLGKSNLSILKSAFKHTKLYHKKPYRELKSYHMQDVVDRCEKGASTKSQIRALFIHLDKFALEIDIIKKGYAELIVVPTKPPSNKQPFTDSEVEKLWEIQNEYMVDTVLILLYTGLRITELLTLKTENIDLKELTLKGGIKTNAGKNRVIPIHPRIKEFILNRYDISNEYLILVNGNPIDKNTYYKYWYEIMKRIGANHTPHECRHTFRTWLDNGNANPTCINLLMGHVGATVGERVYTHKTLDQLREAMNIIN